MATCRATPRACERRAFLCAATALAWGALGGCSTTQIASSFKEPAFTGPPLKKLLVLGVSRQATLRRLFENNFVSALGANSVAAVAGHGPLPQDGPPQREAVEKATHDAGADGVVVTRLLGRETEVRRDMQLELVPIGGFHPGLGHACLLYTSDAADDM
jgi:hypothetical protein